MGRALTPVDAGVARPLIEGLATETTITDRLPAQLFDVTPVGFVEALHRALSEDSTTGPSATVESI
jgi:hypothetical protein